MTKFLRISLLSAFILSCALVVKASDNYGSSLTIKTQDAVMGLVYVNCAETTVSGLMDKKYTHKQPAAPKEDEYVESMRIECEGPGGGSATEQCYYLYAKPMPGYKFTGWIDDKNNPLSGDDKSNPMTYIVTHNTKLPNHNPYYATATFVKSNAVNTEVNLPVASIILEPEAPQIGDKVKATVKTKTLSQNNSAPNKNMMVRFDHWEIDGEFASDKEDFEFTVDKEITLKAIYKELGEIPQLGKYYRVRNVYNRVLSLEGDFKVTVPPTGIDLSQASLRWARTHDHDFDSFKSSTKNDDWNESEEAEGLIWAEASPGTILYVSEGSASGEEINNVVLTCQGIDTKSITGETLNVQRVSDAYYGYYGVVATKAQGAGFQAMPRSADPEKNELERCIVNISQFKEASMYCALAIQPIDIEHIDDFWFGARAELSHDGAYWSSMYTSFPYECYEPDGVEAYYVKETSVTESSKTSYVELTKIESGIVPANTAVLLKCQGIETKGNRLLPLQPNDPRIQELDGDNLLKGVFQLYTNSAKAGRVSFDESTMRVFGANSNGEAGFYKLGANADGSLRDLAANKAYLDISTLSPEAVAASYAIGGNGEESSLDAIVSDAPEAIYDVYDLMGRKVAHPSSGQIYIVNGQKVLWK